MTDTQENVEISIPIEGEQPITDRVEISPVNPQEIQQPQVEPKKEELSTDNIGKVIVPKHPGGRPCEYCENKEAIQKRADEYVNGFRQVDKTKGSNIPYIEELCLVLDVDEDTIGNWATKQTEENKPEHPQFVGTIKKLKTIQKLRLQQRTMGRFNPTGSIFLLKVNHGMIESEKRILAGDKEEPLNITIIEEKK